MTKRMIDADALKAWVKENYMDTSTDPDTWDMINPNEIISIVDELSTTAPVVQEGDGWCYDFVKLNDFKPTDEFWFWLEYKKSKKYRQTICSLEYMECLCNRHSTYNLIAWRPLPPIPTRGDL